MTDSYYNTTNAEGRELIEHEHKAKSQELKILRFFMQQGMLGFTPSKIRRKVFSDKTPVTSVRRALSNLTKAGDLVKTGSKSEGDYGRPEHLWQIGSRWYPQPRQTQLF